MDNRLATPPDGVGTGKYQYKGKVPGFWENLALWLWDHVTTALKFSKKPKLVDPNLDENYAGSDFTEYRLLDPADSENYANLNDTTQEYFN